jgi:hypothetical protein
MQFRKRFVATHLLLVVFTLCIVSWVSMAQAMDCSVTAFQALGLKDEKFSKPVTIESAAIVPAASGVPEYCDVVGNMWPTIRFEVALPTTAWNQRLLMAGNGGKAGTISHGTAGGSLLPSGSIIPAVQMGYAATSTDTGHCTTTINGAGTNGGCPAGTQLYPGTTFANPDYPTPGANPWWEQKLEDHAYRSEHETIVVAKKMVNAYYKRMPAYTYWVGCSTGGRQGLQEAQRYPADFDGISAGAHANEYVAVAMTEPGQMQPQYSPGCDISTFCGGPQIPPANLAYLGSVVYAKCDGMDGLVDGLIDDPRKCTIDVDKELAKCPLDSYVPYTTQPNNCFTTAQLGAIKQIYAGGYDSKGKLVVPGTQTSAEAFSGGWNSWLVSTRLNGTLRYSVANGTFQAILFDPQMPSFNTLADWNWDTSPALINPDRADTMRATNPDLTEFYYRRGKIIVFAGWADMAINPLVNAIATYQRTMNMMPWARPFFALYMVPGMGHCNGGVGCDKVDVFTALVNWVEKGIEPDAITGTASSGAPRTRPICRYPEVARYSGTGSIDDAANFMCVPPVEVTIDPNVLSLSRTGMFTAYITLPKGFEARDWGISDVECKGTHAVGGFLVESIHSPIYGATFNTKDLVGVTPGNAVPFTVNLTFHQGGKQGLTQATATINVVP